MTWIIKASAIALVILILLIGVATSYQQAETKYTGFITEGK